jgi:hypothetical protein
VFQTQFVHVVLKHSVCEFCLIQLVLHRLQFRFELLCGLVDLFLKLPRHDTLHIQFFLLFLFHLLLQFEHLFLQLVLILQQHTLVSLVVRPNNVEGHARVSLCLVRL